MKNVTITIGGKEYAVKELPRKENRAWRARLQEKLGPLVEMIQALPEFEVNKAADLVGLISRASGMLLGAIDEVVDLIVAYSPALQKNQHVLDSAFDSEILGAFGAILKLAFPFDSMLGGTLGRMFGSGQTPMPPTGGSLPSPSTGSDATS
jgi:hypothetical protein